MVTWLVAVGTDMAFREGDLQNVKNALKMRLSFRPFILVLRILNKELPIKIFIFRLFIMPKIKK